MSLIRKEIIFKTNDILNILDDLNQMIVSFDKIASGFEDIDTCSSAIHLFMLEKNILEKLAIMRDKLSENFLKLEFEEYCERDIKYYSPPYTKSKKQLLEDIIILLEKER